MLTGCPNSAVQNPGEYGIIVLKRPAGADLFQVLSGEKSMEAPDRLR